MIPTGQRINVAGLAIIAVALVWGFFSSTDEPENGETAQFQNSHYSDTKRKRRANPRLNWEMEEPGEPRLSFRQVDDATPDYRVLDRTPQPVRDKNLLAKGNGYTAPTSGRKTPLPWARRSSSAKK